MSQKTKVVVNELPNIPKLFICPITLEIMKEPTITSCGHMFEREAIIGWLAGAAGTKNAQSLCPLCNQPVTESQLSPCYPIKTAIQDFLENGTPMGNSKAAALKFSMMNKNIIGLKKVKDSVNKLFKKTTLPSKMDELKSPNTPSSPYTPASNETWARLLSLSKNFADCDINKDDFIIGRHHSADHVINRGEISGRHCHFYRVMKNNPPPDVLPFDCFVEDLSTNGSFVNGKRQSKDDPSFLRHGDEISLGSRFTTQEKPEVATFVDWVFLGTLRSSPYFNEIEKIKNVGTFDDLTQMSEQDFITLGVEHPDAKEKIMNAINTWNDEHQFPVFKFVIVGYENYTHNDAAGYTPPQLIETVRVHPNAPTDFRNQNQNQTQNQMQSQNQFQNQIQNHNQFQNQHQPQNEMGYQPREPEIEEEEEIYDESGYGQTLETIFTFEPTMYTADAKQRQVVLRIKRNHNMGISCVYVSTNNEGTAQAGRDYNPIANELIVFPDRIEAVSYLFRWGMGPEGTDGGWGGGENNIQTINFVLTSQPSFPPPPSSSNPSAVLIIEGSGLPQLPPAPKTIEDTSNLLFEKMTNLFHDVNPVTISGIISREKKNSNDPTDIKTLEESVLRKVLWYRDLPTEEDNLPDDFSYDQASFQYVRQPSKEKKTEDSPKVATRDLPSHKSNVWDASGLYESVGEVSTHPNIPLNLLEKGGTLKAHLPPPPLAKSNGRSPSFSMKSNMFSPPPPPSIANSSSISTSGEISGDELDAFLLLACLDYLRNSLKYSEYLSQNIFPHSTHQKILASSICLEVARLVKRSNANMSGGSYSQRKILTDLMSITDSVMTNRLQSWQPGRYSDKTSSGFEVYAPILKVEMVSRTLIIEDFNELFSLKSNKFRSLYGLFEGFGKQKAAEYVTLNLPANLAKNPNLSTNIESALEDSFINTAEMLIYKNRQESTNYGAIGTLLLIEGTQIFLCWLGSATAYIFKASRENNIVAISLTKRSIGTIEAIGAGSEEDMIEDFLVNPDIVSKLDFTEHSAKPHISEITRSHASIFQEEGPKYIVLASKAFWKTVNSNTVADLISKYLQSSSLSQTNLADYLATHVKQQLSINSSSSSFTNNDIAVLILKIGSM